MPKSSGDDDNLGTRYRCPSCGTKFYDLHRPVPSCPQCGTDARGAVARPAPRAAPKKRSGIAHAAARAAAKLAEEGPDEDSDDEETDSEEELNDGFSE